MCIPHSVTWVWQWTSCPKNSASLWSIYHGKFKFPPPSPSILTYLTTHCFSSHSLVICNKAIKSCVFLFWFPLLHEWPRNKMMVPTDSTNPILFDFDSLVANVATCVWKGVDWKSIANTGLLPYSRVRVVLGGHVQLSASKLKSNFFYRVGIKDSRVKKTGYLYLPFSAFNLPRGAIFNFNTS